MVNRYHALYFYVFISSFAILAFLLKGQVYSRRPIPDISDHGNATDLVPFQTDTDQWPFEMNLGMINYVCTIPASNFHVTENQLIASWYLPPNTRLSPNRLAANQLALKSVQFDVNQCYYVDKFPAELFCIAIFGVVFWIYAIVFNVMAVSLRNNVRGHLKAILITYIPLLVWRMADIMICNYQKSASFTFIRFAIKTNFWACIIANWAACIEFGVFILFKNRRSPKIKIDAAIGKNQKFPDICVEITENTNQITTVCMDVDYLTTRRRRYLKSMHL